jgi:predicted nicotinamide N-methyase
LKQDYFPSFHGNKFWSSSWLLMDFLSRRGLPRRGLVMEIGCGWGLLGMYCAKKFQARVTCVDIDPDVFPFLELHAEMNRVKITTLKRAIGGLSREHLQGIETLVGADVCFWDNMVLALKRLINRALKTGIKRIYIADPGRSTFEELESFCQDKNLGEAVDWRIRYPRPISGRILKIEGKR